MKKSVPLVPQQVGSSTSFQFCRLPVRPAPQSSPAHSGKMALLAGETTFCQVQKILHSQAVYVPDRSSHSNREASMVQLPSHEAHTVASETTLARTRGSGKDHSSSPLSPSTSGLVDVLDWQCSSGPTFASPPTCPSAVYRCLEQRLGCTLRGLHCKRHLVRHRKSSSHQPLGVKDSFSGLKELQASLRGQDCSHSHGQHDFGILHQQTGRYEIRLSVCPPLETAVLVSPQRDSLAGSTHPRSPQCDSGQTVQTQSDDSPEWSLSQSLVHQMGPTTCRPVCNPVQPQTLQVCFTGTKPSSLSLSRENLNVYAFPPISLLNQVISKVMDQGCFRMILIAPGWPNMLWFWDLVTLSTQVPLRLPLQRDLVQQPFNRVLHRNISNLNLHACLLQHQSFGNKGSLTKWQQELKLLRESQPEPSANQSGPFLSGGRQVALYNPNCRFSVASFQRKELMASHH